MSPTTSLSWKVPNLPSRPCDRSNQQNGIRNFHHGDPSAGLLSRVTGPAAKKAKTAPAAPAAPAAVAKKAAPLRHHSEDHIHKHVYAEWAVAKGTEDLLDLLKDRAPGARNWPKFFDARLPKKNCMTKSEPMCVRFQMTGLCTDGYQLTHVFAKDMSQPEFNQADHIFKEIRAPK